MRLISGFIDTYLRLNQQETLLFHAQAATLLGESEKANVMELTTSWKEEGIEIGLQKGREEGRKRESQLVLRLLRKRFGSLEAEWETRIQGFSLDQLDQLADALVDFNSRPDLENWLAGH